jgi:hypothetical protein
MVGSACANYSHQVFNARRSKGSLLNKEALRSELEWMKEAVARQKRTDPSVGRLFESIQDLIEAHLRKLGED